MARDSAKNNNKYTLFVGMVKAGVYSRPYTLQESGVVE